MSGKESEKSGLVKSVIAESDWIPGTRKPEKDYEKVLAYNGKEFFIAQIERATNRWDPNEKVRIWKKIESRGSVYTNEESVTLYLPLTKLFESLPEGSFSEI